MGKEAFISDSISSSRIVSHGKIASLANGFNLPNKEGFTIYARPKEGATIDTPDIVLSVKCMTDENPSEVPVRLNEWNSLYLESIAPDNDILDSIDLYWGAGFNIVKGKGKYYTEPTAVSTRYSGEAQALVTAGSGTGTIKYRLDGGEWSENVPTATNVGVYEVEYKMEGDDLYEPIEPKTLRCAIAEKFVNDPTIELTPSSFTYNGSACVPTVVVKDGQRVIPASEYTVEITNNVNAGTANVVIKDNIAGNYEVLGSTTFNIAKADVTYTAPTAKSNLTYNGSSQAIVNAGTASSGGTLQYKVDDSEWDSTVPSATNAGSYVVQWRIVGDVNHNDVAAAEISVSIAKATRTISFTSAPSSVDVGEAVEVAAVVSAGGGNISYFSSNENVATVDDNVVTGVAQGTCNIIASVAANENYEGATAQYQISAVVPSMANKYLTFIPVEDSTFGFSKAGLSYSLDNGSTWTALAANGTTPTVTAGSKILWKNNTTITPSSNDGIGTFSSSKNFDVQGNIMSLLFGDNFAGQTSLSWKDYAFYYLFKLSRARNAANLVLPATTLASKCYSDMFFQCESLTSAPELPATTLTYRCYYDMFYGCESLTSAPALPATKLAQQCYCAMFASCSSLASAPALPATTLEQQCYNQMFVFCTSLTSAPALPATTLARDCYGGMFRGCSSLTSAPELPATALTHYCYKEMFSSCTSLSYVKMLATDISATDCLNGWLNNVAASGTFVKAEGVTIPSGASGIPEGWTVNEYDPYKESYLTLIPVEDSTFGFSKAGLSYSLDNGSTWTALEANGTTPTVTAGSKILWKNNTTITPSSSGGVGKFSSSKDFDAQGNVMSLYYGDNFAGQTSLSEKNYAFKSLFANSKIRKAEDLILPATTLSYMCYYDMFLKCEKMVSAPKLPATTLANGCYNEMFSDCYSLTSAPELLATTLTNGCYNSMFYSCYKLNYVKMLATDLGEANSLFLWLYGVAASGTFVKADGVTIPSGESGIPEGWTVETYTPSN